MAHLLDQSRTYDRRPRQLVLASIHSLPDQCRRAFRDALATRFPSSYRSVDQIVVCGMGGSALGTDVIGSVFSSELRQPLTTINDYTLPNSVTRRTLVVLSSYSGSTEEVLTAAKQARQRHCRITGLTHGGQLASFFRRHRLPWYRIDGRFNPSRQPRMGLGYSTMGQIGLLAKLRLVKAAAQDVEVVARRLEQRSREFHTDIPLGENEAKELAVRLYRRLPLIMSAQHLVGSAHVFANQLNETAKIFAASFPLPELNHHLLEGLRSRTELGRGIIVLLQSSNYAVRIRQRVRITASIVRRLGLSVATVKIRGDSLLAEAFDVIALAGYTSMYLGVLKRVDPIAIPTVDELKAQLATFRR